VVVSVVPPWCRVVLSAEEGDELVSFVVGGPGHPGLETVDLLARWQLWARRCGWTITVREPCPELEELVDLAGLGPELGLERP
jgi:hypothetical protein